MNKDVYFYLKHLQQRERLISRKVDSCCIIPLIKVYATSQVVRIEVFDLYLGHKTILVGKHMLNRRVMSRGFTVNGVILMRMNKLHKNDILCLGTEFLRHAFLSPKIHVVFPVIRVSLKFPAIY